MDIVSVFLAHGWIESLHAYFWQGSATCDADFNVSIRHEVNSNVRWLGWDWAVENDGFFAPSRLLVDISHPLDFDGEWDFGG